MKLSDLVDFNPKTMTNKLGHVPFIDMSALPTHGRDISAIKLQLARESGSKFKNGDTIIARITPCLENGKGAKITGLPGLGVGQGSTEFIVMRAKFESDENFVYYLSRHPNFRLYAIQQMSGTTGRQRVSWQAISNYELIYISRKNRELFGKILSNLDDKIELNRRMNETLEAMAQAIFRDWFVDFGPVRRKQAGVEDPSAILGGLIPDPARAAELAALFPDRSGDDGLPVGWQTKTIEETLSLSYGRSLSQTVRKLGNIPVYGSGGITGTHDAPLVNGPGIVVGRKGTVGSIFWIAENFYPIDTTFYVEPRQTFNFGYLWFLLQGLGLEHMNTDAAVPGLNRNNVYRLEVPVPPSPLRSDFERLFSNFRQKIDCAIIENKTLAETRDYLLPKLMSGEVRVSDAEALIKEAAE
jgi:type I restriction enzyme S subunit